ncbi:MAG: hypothetical protein OEW46_12240, partial [Actinomycetota bacterium]|nr:hypothetical protein [Actinomycetota bacterium]
MSTRRGKPWPDRERSTSRHEVMVVLGGAALCIVGVATDAFGSIQAAIEDAVPGFTGATFGILLITSLAAGVFALLEGRRGRTERTRRSETETKYQAMIEQVPAVAYTWEPVPSPGAAPAAYVSPQIERLLGFDVERWLVDP